MSEIEVQPAAESAGLSQGQRVADIFYRTIQNL